MREDQMDREERLLPRLESLIQTLPRERDPGMLLEERTVRRLRASGLVAGGRRGIPQSWLVASVAASVALFAVGVATGQWLGTRQTVTTLVEQQQTLAEMSAVVQRTGGEYVSALSRLAETNSAPNAPETVQARQAALQILHQAANEVVRLAPNDPVAVKILQGLDHAGLQQATPEVRQRRRHIVWF